MSKVAVIGLGYVGLPLAIAMAEYHHVVGYDIDAERIKQLGENYDRTNEISNELLKNRRIEYSSDSDIINGADYFIVTVPTPIDDSKTPDLSAILDASRLVGSQIEPGAIIIYESTVWPGLTEDICAPEIEKISGLKYLKDFYVAYSPERINPGDKEHTLSRITKLVSGDCAKTTELVAALYGSINKNNIYIAPNIRTAEAAKVIENAQRDINIAFVNEIAQICHKLGLSSFEVLEAAKTKWNFLDFQPGLVGGHCIGVDPYYLAHRAKQLGHHSEVILAGRKTNDRMAEFICSHILERFQTNYGKILILGLTFKKNVPDLRNSLVLNITDYLSKAGHKIDVHDPLADIEQAKKIYGNHLLPKIPHKKKYDCLIAAVGHDSYAKMTANQILRLMNEDAILVDIPGIWRRLNFPSTVRRWEL